MLFTMKTTSRFMQTPVRDKVIELHSNHREPCLAMQVALEAEILEKALRADVALYKSLWENDV